jgi:hypothetical protein
LLILGVGIAVNAVLGPLVTDVIRYRTSPTTLNQLMGGDVAALFVVGPMCMFAAVLALRRHPAAPVLALGPAAFAIYTLPQLVIGQEYLRLPGNNEWFFPLHLALFICAEVALVLAWSLVDTTGLPVTTRRTDRVAAVVLLVVAGFLVLGLHLPSIIDALRDVPAQVQYTSSPTPFWMVKLMDLGIVVPAAVTTAIGLLRQASWAHKVLFAVYGGFALLAASVAGMAIVMLVQDDPDASVANVVAFGGFALLGAAFAAFLYRPLFRTPSNRRPPGSGPKTLPHQAVRA